MVGKDASSLVMYHLWGRPSVHILPFSFPLHFSFIKFMAISDPFLCDILRLSGFIAPITFMSYSCVYSFYMATTALSACFFYAILGHHLGECHIHG